MNEIAKTSALLLLAAALVAGAYFSRSVAPEFKTEEMVGKNLFPQFTDPLAIKSLEIVKQDAAGERNDFHITEVNGIWSIPSHDNYPADAKDQMGKVAEALTDLTVLEVIQPQQDGTVSGTDSVAFQMQYGVVDPSAENNTLGEGIGTKITLSGVNNTPLVNLIIGKEAASGAKPDSMDMMGETAEKLRYVRIAGQAPVYVIKLDPSQFSTNFDQWIEKNLLDISTLDIKEFFMDEYSFSVEMALTNAGLQEMPKADFVGDLTLSYDGSAVGAEKWKLAKWMAFEGEKLEYKERKLEPEKELHTETLDAMVSALNDLKIVSVLKKPAELASALREGESMENLKLDTSMTDTGFYLVELPDLKQDTTKTKVQLLSNEGDLQLRLQDGIVYNLRFGNLTGTESEIAAEVSAENSAESEAAPTLGANRYLFITAEFDASKIALPELKPVPEAAELEEAEREAAELEKLKQEKETIEKGNQREQERYDSEIAAGKKRAEELSNRFADWYYVIAEDVYKKIHLTEDNVFRVKMPDSESASGGTDVPAMPELTVPELELPSAQPADHLLELPAVEETPTVEEALEETNN